MDKERIKQIRKNMEAKSTEELLEIWVENDRKRHYDETFEVVKQVLLERGETIPPQQDLINLLQAANWISPDEAAQRVPPSPISGGSMTDKNKNKLLAQVQELITRSLYYGIGFTLGVVFLFVFVGGMDFDLKSTAVTFLIGCVAGALYEHSKWNE